MKTPEEKQEFIKLRAEGKSFADISDELGISKSTLQKWEKEFERDIATLKQAEMQALYETFSMSKKARIERLGGVLSKIDEALSKVDLSTVPPEKLLDYKLKYTQALKEEYTPTTTGYKLPEGFKPADILTALADLHERAKAGLITEAQVKQEQSLLESMLKGYQATELQGKVEALEAILKNRGDK